MNILKAVGNVAKGIGKALIHDVLPFPDMKEISGKVAKKQVAEGIRKDMDLPTGGGVQIADLLDDGKINQSVDDVKIETITRMITSASGLIAIIIYLITELF